MSPRVLICGMVFFSPSELDRFFKGLAEVIVMRCKSRSEFLQALTPNGDYAGIVGVYREDYCSQEIGIFDEEIIRALAPSVRWIAHVGAGYDQIDVDACKKHGISVSNTPGIANDATATTALYLILSTLRNFSTAERLLRSGIWKSPSLISRSHDPTMRTLAILGLGQIGLLLAELVHALPMRIIYHSRRRVVHAPAWCEYFADPEQMLRMADVLSVHVPLRSDTEGLVSERWIRAMKKGSVIVNTARGKIIDEEAMIRALEDGHLSSVGLDVYPDEPNVNPRLLELPQVTLLPHMGAASQETQYRMRERAFTNLRDFLVSGKGTDVIPELS